MAITLDEHLAEVDRWKKAVQDELELLSPEARAERLAQIRAFFETALGRALPEAPPRTKPAS